MRKIRPWLKNKTKKVSLFVKMLRPLPRQVRTAKNPVRVVFVCPFGGLSNAMSKAFSASLKKRGITSVVSTFFSSEGKSATELRALAANADFVIPRSGMFVSGKQFKVVAPKDSKILRSFPNRLISNLSHNPRVLHSITLNVKSETSRILKTIEKRFELKP